MIQYKSAWESKPKSLKEEWDKEYERLAGYRYDEKFEPEVKAYREGSIEEFAKLADTELTQTSAIVLIR